MQLASPSGAVYCWTKASCPSFRNLRHPRGRGKGLHGMNAGPPSRESVNPCKALPLSACWTYSLQYRHKRQPKVRGKRSQHIKNFWDSRGISTLSRSGIHAKPKEANHIGFHGRRSGKYTTMRFWGRNEPCQSRKAWLHLVSGQYVGSRNNSR